MRYDPVLFDLDGTVVDSGAIILASLRHATQTVLGRTIPDEQLLATVERSGWCPEMRDFDEALTEACASTPSTTSRCTPSWPRATA